MYKPNISLVQKFKWLASRVAVIYAVLFIFCLAFVDLKTLDERTKVRHLNQAVPDFADMINFPMGKIEERAIDWAPYKKYFELILRYLPDDMLTKQLLGYVDSYTGQEEKAIALFKSSTDMKGRGLFWSNYNLGVIYYKKGMWPQAQEYLFKAVSLNPQLTLFLMQSSLVYKQIFANPAFLYDLNAGINDAKSNAYILLLSSMHHMGQFDKMVLLSDLAVADKNLPKKDAFYYYAGLSFYETNQMDKALLFFQKSLMMEKNDPDVYYYIANIYQKAGQPDHARDFLQISYVLHQKNDPRFPYEVKVNLRFF